jgi:hypothetical protein
LHAAASGGELIFEILLIKERVTASKDQGSRAAAFTDKILERTPCVSVPGWVHKFVESIERHLQQPVTNQNRNLVRHEFGAKTRCGAGEGITQIRETSPAARNVEDRDTLKLSRAIQREALYEGRLADAGWSIDQYALKL